MAQDSTAALEWLKANPNDPRAASIRAQLRAKGVTDQRTQPLYPGAKEEQALTQSWIFDPLEGLGQMAEHLPGVGPLIRRGLPDVVRQWLKNYQKEATATPEQRELRDVSAPLSPFFMMAPELAGTRVPAFVRAAVPGAVSATLQPENDFSWKNKGAEALVGGITAGTLGHVAGQAAARDAARSQNEANAAAHSANLTAHQQATTQAAAQNAAAAAAHVQALQAHEQAKVAAKAAAAPTGPRPAPDFNDFVRSWHDYILQPIPGARRPTAVTPTSLGEIRDTIGAALNRINAQFSFSPSADFMVQLQTLRNRVGASFLRTGSSGTWNRILNQRVFDPINRMTLGRGPALSGGDFASFVTNLDAEADRIARSARSGGPDDADLRSMADGLREAARAVENHADPADPALLQQRRQARESYWRWSVANDAAPPERGGIFKPSDIIKSWSSRVGDANYGLPSNWDAPKQYLERQRLVLETPGPPTPTPLPASLPPKPVKPPKVVVGPPPTKPADVPVPPVSRTERFLGEAAKGAALYGAGSQIGHPVETILLGRPLWNVFMPDLAKLAQQATRLGARAPGVTGAAAGRATDALLDPQRGDSQ